MDEIRCPACGEVDRLRGTRDGDGIKIECQACGHAWKRDPDVCPACGRRSMTDRRVPLIQKARGTQQSIIAYRIARECAHCGGRA